MATIFGVTYKKEVSTLQIRNVSITHKKDFRVILQELPMGDKKKTVCEFFMEEPVFLEQTPKELGKLAVRFHVPVTFFYGEQRMETLSGREKVKAQMMGLLMAWNRAFHLP